MIGELLCKLRGHKLDRNRVWHDGLDHRTSCERCMQPLIKQSREWRAFDTDSDTDLRRKPHPRYDRANA